MRGERSAIPDGGRGPVRFARRVLAFAARSAYLSPRARSGAKHIKRAQRSDEARRAFSESRNPAASRGVIHQKEQLWKSPSKRYLKRRRARPSIGGSRPFY